MTHLAANVGLLALAIAPQASSVEPILDSRDAVPAYYEAAADYYELIAEKIGPDGKLPPPDVEDAAMQTAFARFQMIARACRTEFEMSMDFDVGKPRLILVPGASKASLACVRRIIPFARMHKK